MGKRYRIIYLSPSQERVPYGEPCWLGWAKVRNGDKYEMVFMGAYRVPPDLKVCKPRMPAIRHEFVDTDGVDPWLNEPIEITPESATY